MISCAHMDESEELAMGLCEDEDAMARARAHIESCPACREAHDAMLEERSLFARRAELTVDAPPPFLAPDLFEAADQETTPRPIFARIAPALVAVAACAALFVGVGELNHSGGGGGVGASAKVRGVQSQKLNTNPNQTVTSTGVTTSTFITSITKEDDADDDDDSASSCCTAPVSGVVKIAQRGAEDDRQSPSPSSCEPSFSAPDLADRGLCAIASTSSERVTSSVATP